MQEENSKLSFTCRGACRGTNTNKLFLKKSFELSQFFLKFSDHSIHVHNKYFPLSNKSHSPSFPQTRLPHRTHSSFHVLCDSELPQAWVRTYWNKSNLAAAVSLRKGLHHPPSTTILCQQALGGAGAHGCPGITVNAGRPVLCSL